MTTNSYFTQGISTEQDLVESLIIESMQIYGQDLFYIPRTLISKDDILGEDRLSEFKHTYPIEMYLKGAEFAGSQGNYIEKFGLMIDQSATFVVARKRWEQLIGSTGTTIIPNRPNEGDLIYYPKADSLFQIQYVEHQNPFYQLGKLYVYELSVELFRYSSERISTGMPEVDVFESMKTFDIDPVVSMYGAVQSGTITNPGTGYTNASVIISGDGTGATADCILNNGSLVSVVITNPGQNYTTATASVVGNGSGAAISLLVQTDITKPDGYGENNSFEAEAKDLIFNEDNPFGSL